MVLKYALYGMLMQCLVVSVAFAQVPVTGQVTSGETNESLPGVSVVIKDNAAGTVTNENGEYEINAAEGLVLVFSFLGYETKEVTVGAEREINIALSPDVASLEEVVVIGYGQQKRGMVTSAIGSVKQEDFTKGVVRNPLQLLQGKIAGVSVSSPGGDPTGGTQIMLRGVSTLSSSSDPLIVIDGLPGASLNNIAPEDIESIDVLKDGSAAAIYGTRANGGVIIITTKKNRGAGTATVEYNGYVNYDGIQRKLAVFSADEYRNLKETTGLSGITLSDREGNTDWQDEVLRNPVNQVHNLSVRGGSNTSNYIASLTYRTQNGIMLNSDKNSIIGRLSANHSALNEKLRFNVSVSNNLTDDKTIYYNSYLSSVLRHPTDPVYDDNGNSTEYTQSPYNPVAELKEETASNRWNQFTGSAKITVEPVENWNTSIFAAVQRYDNQFDKANTFRHFRTTVSRLNGDVWKSGDQNWDNTLEITSDYTKSFNNTHNFSVLGGTSFQEFNWQGYDMYAFDFPTDQFGPWNIGAANSIVDGKATMGSSKGSSSLTGFFGRLNYDYQNKYMLMASLRREGSSRFGENNKWGWFPAISAGWRVSQEEFMKNVDFINDLKLRAGYGITGTQPGDPYLSLPLLDYASRMYYNGSWVRGVVPASNPNPNLRWEKKAELNAGVDFTLVNNKISGSIDYYNRVTKDLLYSYNVPVPPNLYPTILDNVGDIKNTGVELALTGSPVQSGNLVWDIGITFAYNKNTVRKFSNQLYQLDFISAGWTGSPIQQNTHRIEEGEAFGNFYGLESVEVDDNGNWIVLNSEGQEISVDQAGEGDKRILGNGIPTKTGSLFTTLRYKNFDFSVSFRGAFDFQILNQYRMQYESFGRVAETNLPESVLDKPYGGDNYVRTAPKYVSNYIEDGDYIKIDNAAIGYTIPFKNRNAIKNARIYVSGLNLYTFTKYKGLDPEVNFKGLDPGFDAMEKYPAVRSLSLGFNISF